MIDEMVEMFIKAYFPDAIITHDDDPIPQRRVVHEFEADGIVCQVLDTEGDNRHG